MGDINLDKARAERAALREGKNKGPTVVLDKKKFTLPVELPYDAIGLVVRVTANDLDAIGELFEDLLGDQHEKFMALKPSVDDMVALVNGVIKEYGFESPGESPASGS